MKLKILFVLALAALFAVAAPRPARAADVSFEFFFDSLSPYGDWIQVDDYGYCWRPSGVDEDWSPYSDGYWTYTDAGWTWVSYEDFGGIVYHYGRWMKLEDEGWCWVPDYEWGPAWVSWRRSDDYVGWAPLPAEAHWHRDRGFSVWVDTSFDIGPAHFNFCRWHDFGAPVLRPVILRRSENIVIIANTVNITNITYNTRAGCVFNGGLEYAYVNRYVARPIPALKLVRNTNITVVNNHIVNNHVTINRFNSTQRGNQLTVLAPTLVRPQQAQVAALVQPKVRKVIPQGKVTRGWGTVPADQRVAIRKKLTDQTQGLTPETAPAKPLNTADLKVVPVKADPNAKLPVPKKIAGATPGTEADRKAGNVTTAPAGTPPPGATPGGAGTVQTIRGKKPVKGVTPGPIGVAKVPGNPPAGVVASTPAPVKPVRPGVIKPFNPNGDDTATAGTVRKIGTPPPIDRKTNAAAEAAVAKRNAAIEAARNQAAMRQRTLQQNANDQEAIRRSQAQDGPKQRILQQQQQQESIRRSQSQGNEAAAARQRMLQQQDQQQQQQALRERSAQAAEARQRALQSQQSQAAAAARAQALQRQRPVPQNVIPPGTVQKAPPRGKRPLTPEEAARLQQQNQ